jgi:hypothetical protein
MVDSPLLTKPKAFALEIVRINHSLGIRFDQACQKNLVERQGLFSTKSTLTGGWNIATQCEILASLE